MIPQAPTLPTPAAIARGTLRRRISQEQRILAKIIQSDDYRNLSYQSGLLHGLLIAARLTEILEEK